MVGQPGRGAALDEVEQRGGVDVRADQSREPVEVRLADVGEGARARAPVAAAASATQREQRAADRVALEQAVPGGAEHVAAACDRAARRGPTRPWRIS